MKQQQSLKAGLVLGALLLSQSVFASGFEKSIPWGGQTSGVAGIGASYMQGSQALFFNPAGLVSDKPGQQDVSLNLSPTFPKFNEGVDASGTTEKSRTKTLVPFSLIYGNTINDKIGFGIGGYVSGGTSSDFQNEPLHTIGSPESMVDLMVTELAAGVGYKIMDGLKVGAAWRMVNVKANLDIVDEQAGGAAIINSQNTNLTDSEYNGWKLGAQYKLNEKWDLGLTYRSEVDFKAKGSQTNILSTAASQQTLSTTGVTMGTALPAAWTLGSSYQACENWKVFGEYVFTNYSHVTNLAVNTNAGTVSTVALHFQDQHNIRLAAEYKGFMLPIRFGYIWTSQVTNSSYTIAGLTPPGTANTVTLGTGQAFNLGGQALRADGGLEYTKVSGSSNGGPYGTALQPVYTTGSNRIAELAVHLGVSYMF